MVRGKSLPLFYNCTPCAVHNIIPCWFKASRFFYCPWARQWPILFTIPVYMYSSVGQTSPLAIFYRNIIINMNTHYEWCEIYASCLPLFHSLTCIHWLMVPSIDSVTPFMYEGTCPVTVAYILEEVYLFNNIHATLASILVWPGWDQMSTGER